MFRYYFIFLICAVSFLQSEESSSIYIQAKPEESLFLRRVVEYWEEGNFEIVKNEMQKHLKQNEKGAFSDYLLALLGDIYLAEKDFEKAKELYEQIEHEYLKKQTFINYLHSLHQTASFEKIIFEADKRLEHLDINDSRLIYLLADSYYQLGYENKNEEAKLIKAQELFLKLLNTDMGEKALLPLAQINEKLKDFPAASKYYYILGKKEDQEDADRYLFLAAQTTALYDKEKAMEMFREICMGKGAMAEEAAYNLMLLAMEEKQYKKVIDEAPLLLKDLKSEKASFIYYLIGKSYFCLEDYSNAAKELKRYLKLEDKKSDQMRSVLALMMQCAKNIDDIKLFNFAYSHFATFFPDDQDLAKVLFAKAMFHKKQKDYESALADFEKLIAEFSSFQEDSFVYEYANLLYQMKRYGEVVGLVEKSLKDEKTETEQNRMIRLCINSYMQLKKEDDVNFSQEKFMQMIECFLKQDSQIAKEEKLQITFLLAQIQIDEKKYAEAKENLSMLRKTYPFCKQIGQITYMLAVCYREVDEDLLSFCEFAKKALQTKNVDHANIHLALYNGYLERAKKESSLFANAAEHLYEAQKEIEIQKANLLWLGEYYFELACEEISGHEAEKNYENLEKAKIVLEKILFFNNELVFDETFTDFERVVLDLADIYEHLSQKEKKLNLLENLADLYEKKPEFSWEGFSKTYFALAEIYERLNEKEKAISYYDKVLSQNNKSREYFFADLNRLRLILDKVPKDKKTAANHEVVNCLNELKNLKIQKRIETEPVHLEAALDYIDLVMEMEKEINEEKRISLLEKVKRDFSLNDDIISHDYHMKKQKLPKKGSLFDTYMLFIDVKIQCSKFLLNPTIEEKEKALASINRLREKELIMTPYLEHQIDKCIKVLTIK